MRGTNRIRAALTRPGNDGDDTEADNGNHCQRYPGNVASDEARAILGEGHALCQLVHGLGHGKRVSGSEWAVEMEVYVEASSQKQRRAYARCLSMYEREAQGEAATVTRPTCMDGPFGKGVKREEL